MAKKKATKKKSDGEMGEVLEIVNFIKDYMMENLMTRDEGKKLQTQMYEGFLSIEERLYSIEQELKDIKLRLITVEHELEQTGVLNKEEVDAIWKRIMAIEKRLDMRTHK